MVKVHNFRDTTIDDLKDHLIPIIKKEPDTIIFHVGMNDVTSKTSRQVLDDLLQLKIIILNTITHYQVIILRPTMRLDNGKAAITICNPNAHLSQLQLSCNVNSNIHQIHLWNKGLHLNQKGKENPH